MQAFFSSYKERLGTGGGLFPLRAVDRKEGPYRYRLSQPFSTPYFYQGPQIFHRKTYEGALDFYSSAPAPALPLHLITLL